MESDTFQSLEQPNDVTPVRLFFSINPPPDVIHHLSAIQSEVRRVLETGFDPKRAVRWTRPTQFHLTILFLGNVPPAEIASLETAANELMASLKELPILTLSGLGSFPAFHRPRVLWVGCRSNGLLQQLQSDFLAAFSKKIPLRKNERSYPHITIARFRHLPRRFAERMRILSEKNWFPECVWRVNGVSLMRSVPAPDGAEYTCLSNFSPDISTDGC
ncbi:MAG: RNA 2',3'-cyclic phosphodiesterase [Verrucomicrobia bacterium]|nr:RNA 2',3'-cyclic phosphodiesterase [Verrucomicrobiota bacterium]